MASVCALILHMTRRLMVLIMLGGLLCAGMKVASPSTALPLPEVISKLRDANGHYRWAGASLTAADCSGLVSVAQALAMGQEPRRLGDTSTLFAGRWPHAIPGATPDDAFVIAASSGHMMASIQGVGIEATTTGTPFLVGASSVWDSRFQRRWHIDPAVLTLA